MIKNHLKHVHHHRSTQQWWRGSSSSHIEVYGHYHHCRARWQWQDDSGSPRYVFLDILLFFTIYWCERRPPLPLYSLTTTTGWQQQQRYGLEMQYVLNPWYVIFLFSSLFQLIIIYISTRTTKSTTMTTGRQRQSQAHTTTTSNSFDHNDNAHKKGPNDDICRRLGLGYVFVV